MDTPLSPVPVKTGFTLWQLPSQVDTIGNSYVLQSRGGEIIVLDGGAPQEENYLRGVLAALGNRVDAWLVSHPHDDHMGALNAILKDLRGLKIMKIYHSRFSDCLIDSESPYGTYTHEFYRRLSESGVSVADVREPGLRLSFDGLELKILSVTNEEIRINPYNNSSMVIRAWDERKSVVFLGDLGVEGGDKLLNGTFGRELDCDYLQMAHHGQAGVSREFYMQVKFGACLWPTPTWVYNNDIGGGFDTHVLQTIHTRNWMKEKGIRIHYVSCEELARID